MLRLATLVFDEVVPFGKWLRAALQAVVAWIGRNRLLAAVIALLCLSGWLWNRGNVALDQVAAIKAAQHTAANNQATVNHEPARKSADIARKSDDEAPAYYAAGHSAADAYADAHSVRGASCPTGHPDLSGTDSTAQVDDGPGEAPGMVAVTRDDFDLLTGNSLRLAKVHQDAEALISDGVAVPFAASP